MPGRGEPRARCRRRSNAVVVAAGAVRVERDRPAVRGHRADRDGQREAHRPPCAGPSRRRVGDRPDLAAVARLEVRGTSPRWKFGAVYGRSKSGSRPPCATASTSRATGAGTSRRMTSRIAAEQLGRVLRGEHRGRRPRRRARRRPARRASRAAAGRRRAARARSDRPAQLAPTTRRSRRRARPDRRPSRAGARDHQRVGGALVEREARDRAAPRASWCPIVSPVRSRSASHRRDVAARRRVGIDVDEVDRRARRDRRLGIAGRDAGSIAPSNAEEPALVQAEAVELRRDGVEVLLDERLFVADASARSSEPSSRDAGCRSGSGSA